MKTCYEEGFHYYLGSTHAPSRVGFLALKKDICTRVVLKDAPGKGGKK